MSDLDLRKRIELALLEFAMRYTKDPEMLGSLTINEEVVKYLREQEKEHRFSDDQFQEYNFFYERHKMYGVKALEQKMKAYN